MSEAKRRTRKPFTRERHGIHATRDYSVDAGYIYLAGKIKKGGCAKTVSVKRAPGIMTDINLDFAADGRLIGIELLDLKLMPWRAAS